MGVDETLVEDGVGEVVYEHLDADVGWARVFLLFGVWVVLFPLGLALAVGYVALANVFHYVLDGFLDAAFTDALAADEYVHECGLMIYVVPVPELYFVQVCAQGGEYGVGYGRLVDVWHVLG